jgi:hypothetical protein
MTTYHRIVSGVSTAKLLVHQLNRLLLKYQGRILEWVFIHGTADQTQALTNLFNAIHEIDPWLQALPDD